MHFSLYYLCIPYPCNPFPAAIGRFQWEVHVAILPIVHPSSILINHNCITTIFRLIQCSEMNRETGTTLQQFEMRKEIQS